MIINLLTIEPPYDIFCQSTSVFVRRDTFRIGFYLVSGFNVDNSIIIRAVSARLVNKSSLLHSVHSNSLSKTVSFFALFLVRLNEYIWLLGSLLRLLMYMRISMLAVNIFFYNGLLDRSENVLGLMNCVREVL